MEYGKEKAITMSKWKKIVNIILTVVIAAVLVVPVFADEIYDAKQKQRELEKQLSESESRLAELRENVTQAQNAVDEIDAQISQVEAVINDYEVQKGDLELKISELQAQIDEKQVQIGHEYEMMSKRIRFLYENLGNSYIEAFLTSETFADALNKIQYLIELSDYDRKQMEALQKLQDAIQADRDAVQSQKDEIETLISAQNDQKVVLDGMLEVKAEALGVAKNAEANEAEQNAAIAGMLAEQKETVDALVAEYNARIAAEMAANGGVVPVDSGGMIWTGGDFLWPLPAPFGSDHISSWYGGRMDPFGGGYVDYHNGIDIWAYCNTPIYAVLPGTVVMSSDGWNGGCGNYTVIYHGGNLYTEYMHQNSRAVSVGQTVGQGEVIGYVGTTGSSTGYHLHIGVCISDHGFDYSCRVDPAPYLGLY